MNKKIMKAVIRKKYGGIENLQIVEQEIPKISPDDILVKVHCTTVNRTDCHVLAGTPFVFRFFIGLWQPKREILGTDFVGEIIEVGNSVENYKKGDRIIGLNDEGISSQAEFIKVNKNMPMAIVPDHISDIDAVGGLEGGFYAYGFKNGVTVNKGDKVLVNGATGGIGSALIQLLVNEGLVITAVCDTKNIELIKALGVDKIIDYKKVDFTKSTDKYSVVFDAVGKSRFKYCKKILKDDGVYLSSELGPGLENIFLALLGTLKKGKKVVFSIPNNCQGKLNLLVQLLSEKKYKPIIDRIYPIEDAAEAYKFVASGMKTGNVILNINLHK